MKYKILWRFAYTGPYSGHRDAPADPRPKEVEADKYTLIMRGGNQPIGVQFFKDDAVVLTLLDLPLAITLEPIVPE